MGSEALAQFDESGTVHLAGAAMSALDALRCALARWPDGESGTRISGDSELRKLLEGSGPIGCIVAGLIGKEVFPVRAISFDKNDINNWALGWHQDRTIAVKRRCDLPGYGPWTRKQGILHVQPPFLVIAGLRTIRIHLDPVSSSNGPLLVAAGSHRLGLVAAEQCKKLAETMPRMACLANAGDIWAYHTAILHASERSEPGQRRRVLQVDYASDQLQVPLEWLGI